MLKACAEALTFLGHTALQQGNYVAAQIDVDNDNILDIIIAGSELPGAAKSTSIAAYKVENRSLKAVPGITIEAEVFRPDSDFVALGAADIDADGLRARVQADG